MDPKSFEQNEEPAKIERIRMLIEKIQENEATTENLMRDLAEASRKHKEWYNYRLWHVLIGSTPRPETTEFDTPNREIETFFNSLVENYLPSEEV